ncbi:purine and uridine phosphorylase, partial [Delitschia confertaspora ATCC 74209]
YTIGWIAPLALKLTAAKALRDGVHGNIHIDGYIYYGRRIREHNVIMAAQPEMGTDAASDLAARMRAAFKNIEYFMVVGIGDGVPSYGSSGARSQIVLGGVVVSSPKGSYGGVIQYDYGAWMEEGRHEFFRHSNGPPATVLTAVNGLRAKHPLTPGMKIPCSLEEIRLKIREDERTYFKGQGANQDRLFQYNYPHPEASGNKNCKNCCNLKRSQLRESRGPQAIRQVDTPKIHYGNIGSSNQLQMSATKRNQLHKKLEVICFEMEGAGVIQRNPFLVIREICDYSDSHKNKKWQPYAAATAAAYAKELLEILPT